MPLLLRAELFADASGAVALYSASGVKFVCDVDASGAPTCRAVEDSGRRLAEIRRLRPAVLRAYAADVYSHLTAEWFSRAAALYAAVS